MGRPAASSSSRTTAHPVSGLRNVNRSMVPSTVTSRSVGAVIWHVAQARHCHAMAIRYGLSPFPRFGCAARYARSTRAAIVVAAGRDRRPELPATPSPATSLHMIRVQVRPNEPLEAALRRFKRQCNYAGIFRLAKKHAYHEKSSDKRRREERERLRNIVMAERKRGGNSGGRSNRKRRARPG